MLPKDFVLYVEAYNERMVRSHDIARRGAYFSLAPHLSKPMSMASFFKEYWPLPGDGEGEESRRERLINKLKRLKEDGGRSTQNTDRG